LIDKNKQKPERVINLFASKGNQRDIGKFLLKIELMVGLFFYTYFSWIKQMIFINQYIENRVSSITRVMDLDRKDMHYIYKPSNLLRILIFLNNIKTRSFPIS